MSPAAYVPGDAHGVVTTEVAVLVKDGDAAMIAQLWEAAATPDVMALLDVLGAHGFAAMPEFAAVVRSGDDLRVVTRGAATVRLVLAGEETTCDAVGVATWSEQRLVAADAADVRLTLGAASEDVRLPIVAGVVRASEVSCAEEASDVEPEEAPDVEPEEASDVEAEEAPEVEPEEAPETIAAAPVDSSMTMAEPDEASFDALFGATVAGRRPEDAAVRELEEIAPVGEPPHSPHSPDGPTTDGGGGDHDDHTMTPEEFARLRGGGRPSTPQTPSEPLANKDDLPPRPRLILSTGREVTVDRPVLVGRSPQARNMPSAQLPLLVVVDDPYVSGTHLEFAMVGTELRATDVSTNGTLLQRSPGDPPASMSKNVSTPILDGAVLHVSDTVSITVSTTVDLAGGAGGDG